MGHPDKVADQVSDAILDALLEQDPDSRVACETMVTTGMAVVAGEVTCDGFVDIPSIVRKTVLEIGYDDGRMGPVEDSAKHAIVQLQDVPNPEPSHCETVKHWIVRASEMTGCKNARGETIACRKRGDGCCSFRFEWD